MITPSDIMTDPELIHILGQPYQLVSSKLIQSWDSKGKSLKYTAERVGDLAPTRSGGKATTEAAGTDAYSPT